MNRQSVALIGLILAGLLAVATGAIAEDHRFARLRYIEGDVVLYPSDNDRPTDATINSPVLDGDELETQNGRAEISFRNGIVVRLADYSAIRMDSVYSPMSIALIQGTLFVDSHMVDRFGDELEIRAGDAQVFLINEGNLRVDLGSQGTVRVTTLDGEAEVRASGSRVLLEREERTYVDPGRVPERPEQFARNYDELDDWNQERIDVYARNDGSGDRYGNDSIYYESYDLDNYGDWRAYGTYGNVWVPRVYPGWRPYYDGRWDYFNNSYFWVSYEPWGWAPYHYGRWGWDLGFGWYWIPGYNFAPAWVNWYTYGNYVGWCATGYYGYPNYGYGYDHDYYYPGVQKQKTLGVADSWTFVNKASLGDKSVKHISVSSSEVKNIQIDKARVAIRPDKSLATYVAGKGSKSTGGTLVKPSQKPTSTSTSSQKSVDTWSTPGSRSYGDRDRGGRNQSFTPSPSTKGSVSSQKSVTTGTKSTSSTSKGSNSSGVSSGKSATPSSSSKPPSSTKSSTKSSSKPSGTSSTSKKVSPPHYDREDQFERYLPGKASYGSRLSGTTVSPSYRDRVFDTRSYQDSDSYRGMKSVRDYFAERNAGDERSVQWFRDSRSYDEPDRAKESTVSPRYLESARKFFETYEASRNTESYRGNTSSRDSGSQRSYSSPKQVEPRSSGSYSGKGYSPGSSSGKGYSSAGRSASGSARTASPRSSSSGAQSVKKPH